ncbi:hypothetical protein pb186bvf_001601 [Paramecium bursaria]
MIEQTHYQLQFHQQNFCLYLNEYWQQLIISRFPQLYSDIIMLNSLIKYSIGFFKYIIFQHFYLKIIKQLFINQGNYEYFVIYLKKQPTHIMGNSLINFFHFLICQLQGGVFQQFLAPPFYNFLIKFKPFQFFECYNLYISHDLIQKNDNGFSQKKQISFLMTRSLNILTFLFKELLNLVNYLFISIFDNMLSQNFLQKSANQQSFSIARLAYQIQGNIQQSYINQITIFHKLLFLRSDYQIFFITCQQIIYYQTLCISIFQMCIKKELFMLHIFTNKQ